MLPPIKSFSPPSHETSSRVWHTILTDLLRCQVVNDRKQKWPKTEIIENRNERSRDLSTIIHFVNPFVDCVIYWILMINNSKKQDSNNSNNDKLLSKDKDGVFGSTSNVTNTPWSSYCYLSELLKTRNRNSLFSPHYYGQNG